MMRRLAPLLPAVLLAAILVVIAWPQPFGLDMQPGFAQLLALRSVQAATGIAFALAFVALAVAWRRMRVPAVAIAVVLALFGGGNAAVLAARGLDAGDAASTATPGAVGDELTVLAWNTLGGAVPAETIATAVASTGADVVSLPETNSFVAEGAAQLLAAQGIRMNVYTRTFDERSGTRVTSLLVSPALGEYRIDESLGADSTMPTLVARPLEAGSPVLVAVHPVAPVPGSMESWRSDLAWIADLCAAGQGNLVMAGDFNATLDHLARFAEPGAQFGDCTDAALATRAAGVGTWPTNVPAIAGAPIDHVLAAGWRPTAFSVIGSEDTAGSDHRPIVARLVRE